MRRRCKLYFLNVRRHRIAPPRSVIPFLVLCILVPYEELNCLTTDNAIYRYTLQQRVRRYRPEASGRGLQSGHLRHLLSTCHHPLPSKMMIAPSSISRSASPALYSPYGRAGSDSLPYVKSLPSPGLSDIHIERGPRTPRQRRSLAAAPLAGPLGYEQELEYRQHVSSLLAAKNAVFSVSGRIPLDPSQLVLFFRTKVCVHCTRYQHPS